MTLFVVATPIGNANDISIRALDVLKSVDVIAAEDTRKTSRFLAGHGIKNRTISHHEHNERTSAEGIIKLLQEGKPGTPPLRGP
jgi:16S rRNA (cytidine1402-2'-O)-methyltransferase